MILPELAGAKEVAVLVKCLPNIEQAAALIEQYARTVASGARLDGAQDAYDRMQALVRNCMDRPMPIEEFERIQAKVAKEMKDA